VELGTCASRALYVGREIPAADTRYAADTGLEIGAILGTRTSTQCAVYEIHTAHDWGKLVARYPLV
jgi:hypothetical protein